MNTKIQYPSASQVARAFAEIIRDWLSPKEVRHMNIANAFENNPRVCHSHDYCDANQAMLDAFQKCGLDACSTGGDDIGPMDDKCESIWNEAWEIARKALFFPEKIKVVLNDLPTEKISLAQFDAADFPAQLRPFVCSGVLVPMSCDAHGVLTFAIPLKDDTGLNDYELIWEPTHLAEGESYELDMEVGCYRVLVTHFRKEGRGSLYVCGNTIVDDLFTIQDLIDWCEEIEADMPTA